MNRSFWWSYAAGLVALTTLISIVSSFAYLASSARPGAGSQILVSLVRSSAPTGAGSALLLAFALWAEALSPASLAQRLDGGLRRALSLALPGYAVAVGVAFGACFGVATALLPDSARRFGVWLGDVTRPDLAAGLAFTLLDSVLIALLARRYAVRLRAAPLSLPAKLIVIVTVTVPLRVTLALISAPFLPG